MEKKDFELLKEEVNSFIQNGKNKNQITRKWIQRFLYFFNKNIAQVLIWINLVIMIFSFVDKTYVFSSPYIWISFVVFIILIIIQGVFLSKSNIEKEQHEDFMQEVWILLKSNTFEEYSKHSNIQNKNEQEKLLKSFLTPQNYISYIFNWFKNWTFRLLLIWNLVLTIIFFMILSFKQQSERNILTICWYNDTWIQKIMQLSSKEQKNIEFNCMKNIYMNIANQYAWSCWFSMKDMFFAKFNPLFPSVEGKIKYLCEKQQWIKNKEK